MPNLEIKCPFCGSETRARSSLRPTLLTVQASINCPNCGQLKAEFVGQLINIKRAVFVDCEEASHWEKPEKELIKEGKIQGKDNAQRLKELRGTQQDLFAHAPKPLPPEKMTPVERMELRKRFSNSH